MSMYTAKIVSVARSYIASRLWMYAVAKDNFGKNTNKCNKFVYDVMVAAGIKPPPQVTIPGLIWDTIRPPTAAEWATATVAIPYWEIATEPQPGDVVAEAHHYSDATGHCGIVVGNKETVCYKRKRSANSWASSLNRSCPVPDSVIETSLVQRRGWHNTWPIQPPTIFRRFGKYLSRLR